MFNKKLFAVLLLCFFLTFSSCKGNSEPFSDIADEQEEGISNVLKIDTDVFNKNKHYEIVEKEIAYKEYVGGKDYIQRYTLNLYKKCEAFSNVYPSLTLNKVVFNNIESYDTFALHAEYKNYLYFLVEQNGNKSILRYNLDTCTEETVYHFNTDKEISIYVVNDRYVIWKEDDNANWLKASLNCLDMNTGVNKLFYTYTKDENGYMYSWNFGAIVINDNEVYFQDTVSVTNNKANVNLYKYNIEADEITLVAEKRATEPIYYNGVSYLGYDESKKEYVLKNTMPEQSDIFLGQNYLYLSGYNNTLVAKIDDGLILYKNNKSYPIIKSSLTIDLVDCNDSLIVWDGWNNDCPMYYDVKNDILVYVDTINDGKHYIGHVTDDYLIFGAAEYTPNKELGGDAVTTSSLVYYYISTSALR